MTTVNLSRGEGLLVACRRREESIVAASNADLVTAELAVVDLVRAVALDMRQHDENPGGKTTVPAHLRHLARTVAETGRW